MPIPEKGQGDRFVVTSVVLALWRTQRAMFTALITFVPVAKLMAPHSGDRETKAQIDIVR